MQFSNSLKPNSIPNILKNARSEQHFAETMQRRSKLNNINNKEVIDDMQRKVNKKIRKHADVLVDRFKGELYNIKKKYADLEMSTNENLMKIKLDKEIIDSRAERDK